MGKYCVREKLFCCWGGGVIDGRPVEDGGASDKSATESAEEQTHTILEFAGARHLIHKDWDASRGGVAILVEVGWEFFSFLAEVFANRVDDAEISLVEEIHVDVCAGEAIFLEDDIDILDAGADGEFEYLAALHDKRLSFFLDTVVRCCFQRPFIIEDISVGVGSDAEVAEALALSDNDSASAVGEEDRGFALMPIAEARRFLSGYDEDIFCATRFDESVGDVEGVDEASAGAVEVGAGATTSERAEEDTAQRRSNIAVSDIRADKVINFFRGDTRGLEGGHSGCDGEFAKSFLAKHATSLDTGAGGDPAVGSFEETSEHIVSHNFLGEGATCSNNFHKTYLVFWGLIRLIRQNRLIRHFKFSFKNAK